MTALEMQLQGYRLTTAQILYHMPDHPGLIQEFLWQHMDLAPKYPVLGKFLDFWSHNLDGKLHSVHVAHAELIGPTEFQAVEGKVMLH